MKRSSWLAVVLIAFGLSGCLGDSSTTPTRDGFPDVSGVWLASGGPFSGYGVDLMQTGSEVTGRPIWPDPTLTGPLEGTVSTGGTVSWDSHYFNSTRDIDHFEGRIEGQSITGTLTLSLFNRNTYQTGDVTLVLLHRQVAAR